MFMQTINASVVRKDFSAFLDSVVREKPAVIKRRRDSILNISTEQAKLMLNNYKFKANIGDSGSGSLMGKIEGFDLLVEGNTPEEVIHNLAADLLDYAYDYFNSFDMYFNSPNRKNHFPYVLRVLLADSIKDITAYIDA